MRKLQQKTTYLLMVINILSLFHAFLVREVTIDSGIESGKTVQIAMITDSHLNTNIPGHTEALIKAMKCAKFSGQIVLCGDNVESASSSANMALLQEVVWDIYPDKKYIGGAPLNFAAHLAKHGEESYMLSCLGKDELGKEALLRLKKAMF